ncbi:hypothetical protein AB0D38_34250, partial [Streptomyces sp. NPDC048279]
GLTGSGRLDEARRAALELRDACATLGEHWTPSHAEHQPALIAFPERQAHDATPSAWRTVGHPPCGTPEMASLRDKCEDRLVRSLGKRRYERTFRRAATSDARSLVAWGASGGPAPGSEPAVLDRVLPPHCVEPCGPLLFGFA